MKYTYLRFCIYDLSLKGLMWKTQIKVKIIQNVGWGQKEKKGNMNMNKP